MAEETNPPVPARRLTGLGYDLRVLRACAVKDIRSALTERVFTAIVVILPINILILFILFVLNGGQAPTAIVLQDDGPYAQQFVTAMQQAHSFLITRPGGTDAATANQLLTSGQIVAVVTVPANFDRDLQAGRPISLPVRLNNLNVDFTNDIRRAVPLAITSFYATTFPNQVVVQTQEVDTQAHDTGYVPYLAVSILVIALMVGGLIQAGAGAAREYETGTIKELLLSPASRWAILTGKVLGAFIFNLVSAALVMMVLVFIVGVAPLHWGETLLFALLVMVLFCALGALVGTLTRTRFTVIPLSLGVVLPLFFLSGAFGPASWGSAAVADIAKVFPVYYAIADFQYAFHGFTTTATSVGQNTLVLALYTLVAIIIAAVVMRRSSVAH